MNDAVIDMPNDLGKPRHHLSLEEDPTPARRHRGITALTVDLPDSGSKNVKLETNPSRWATPEFLFYYLAAVIVIPIMVWVPVSISSPTHDNYYKYNHRLRPGWIFGRALDNSDAQYRSFRDNVPALAALAAVFVLTKVAYTRFTLRSLTRPPENNFYLIPLYHAFSALFLIGLHGTSIVKIFVILSANYYIAKKLGKSRAGPLVTWAFNVAVLFLNERYEGYRYASIHSSLETLDIYEGLYPRWHISFNITMLRLISFNMDYYWACKDSAASSSNASPSLEDEKQPTNEKQRIATALPVQFYTYANYIAYVLYPPLYIAGPIMSYNNFVWQLRNPVSIPKTAVARYLLRFLLSLGTMELILHFMYVVAMKDARAWQGLSPFELSMVGFWNLMVVWLKLLLPWRFFRLWALAGGVDAPENMVRCMANNYSAFGFWRSWHRSYNLWIVRYIHIPLGGAHNVVVSTALVFTFVALWHDLSFRLLAWGWLVSVFVLPELAARYVLPESKYGSEPWYRHACALGGVLNVLMMISANLVGFVIGTDGMLYMVSEVFGTWSGLRFLVSACACIFIGVQLMFEYREEEKRRGIYRRF
ncbi:MBOAT-domain-containing protein [Coniophora puteana RWD-64-598 SS2]|uniref:MBOAT-domain-containing protein n=1 Tax=Coniophora puteana (strain RWD-64-598) TaxID=741705 RepID=A0A5M3MXI4_CONPW|nr:MBOAT-domain-containing protein [Coniophora puteana RWD-64-598 SS2]EIW83800.1 MBOAT-domain-containing protein [Coniophora puteana RWD-64-598 SS2]